MCLLGGGTGSGEAHNCEFSQEMTGSRESASYRQVRVESDIYLFFFLFLGWGGHLLSSFSYSGVCRSELQPQGVQHLALMLKKVLRA